MNEREPTNHTNETIEIRCADAVELVTDYFDDALSESDLAIFEHHLEACEGCTIFVDQFKMTITITSEIGRQQLEVMPDNFESLIELLAEIKPQATN